MMTNRHPTFAPQKLTATQINLSILCSTWRSILSLVNDYSNTLMFPKFELICGEDIWQHVIIVVSNTGFYHNPCEDINFESWRRRIKGTLPQICQRSTLVFDSKKTVSWKNALFRPLPELPPPPLNSGNLYNFFPTSKFNIWFFWI